MGAMWNALKVVFIACLQIITGEETVIVKDIHFAAVDEWGGHIGPASHLAPFNRPTTSGIVAQRDVSARAGTQAEDGAFRMPTTGHDEVVVLKNWRGRRDL